MTAREFAHAELRDYTIIIGTIAKGFLGIT